MFYVYKDSVNSLNVPDVMDCSSLLFDTPNILQVVLPSFR